MGKQWVESINQDGLISGEAPAMTVSLYKGRYLPMKGLMRMWSLIEAK